MPQRIGERLSVPAPNLPGDDLIDFLRRGPRVFVKWDADYCLENDKIGVTASAATRLCRRGARWAMQGPLVEALVPWWEATATRIDDDRDP